MATQQPQTAKGRATRARIVTAAAELILERGADRMPLDEVLSRASASKSQLYLYFDDKSDLVHAAVRQTVGDVIDTQEALMEHLDSWEAIRRWFDCLIDLQETGERLGCPLATLTGYFAETDDEVRAELYAAFEQWEGYLATGLEEMQQRGEVDPSVDTTAFATAAMAMVQGGLILTQVRRDPHQLAIVLDAAYEHLRSKAVTPA